MARTSGRLRLNTVIGRKFNEDSELHSAAESAAAVTARLNSVLDQFQTVTPRIMLEALEPTFQKSQDYCPVDTGRMKHSGYLEIMTNRGNPRVEMGYGFRGNPPYTGIQHEDPNFRHTAPTRYKWLQAAVMEDLDAIEGRIAAAYKGFIGS